MHFSQYQALSVSYFAHIHSQISQKKAGLIVMQNVRHFKWHTLALLNQPVDPTLHSKKSLNVPFLATKSAVLSTMSVGHRSGRQLQERSSLRCKHRKQRYTQQEPHSLAFAILQFLITYSIQKQRGRLGRFCHVNVLNIYLVDRDEDDSEQPWSFFLVPSV